MGKSKFNKVNMRFRSGHPERLDDLLTLSDEQLKWVDVARINLLCATGLPGAENIDIERIVRVLDQWARHVEHETNRHLYRVHHPRYARQYAGSEARLRLEMLCQTLQEDFGVRYNPARIHDPDFSNAKDLFIHGMIEDSNGGTCASMPVLYVAVARRLGYPLRLVSAKGHLFCRWEGKGERMNFDGAANGGCSFIDDAYYRRWPVPITDAEVAAGLYLASHTSTQELAGFMAARGHCLEEHPRFDETIQAYEHAVRLDPSNPNYRGFLSMTLRNRTAADTSKSAPLHPQIANAKASDQWERRSIPTSDIESSSPSTMMLAQMRHPGNLIPQGMMPIAPGRSVLSPIVAHAILSPHRVPTIMPLFTMPKKNAF